MKRLFEVLKQDNNASAIKLGGKTVTVKKLTPVKWKELFSVVDNLPGLIIQVMTAPQKDFYATVLHAFDLALDDIVKVVSILSEVDEDYLKNNAGLDEIVEYVALTVNTNRLDKTVKNLKSLLPKK